jgi:hypothetical protein
MTAAAFYTRKLTVKEYDINLQPRSQGFSLLKALGTRLIDLSYNFFHLGIARLFLPGPGELPT